MAKEKANTKKKWWKTLLKVLGILVAVALVIGLLVYSFVLQYPELKENPIIGKWYRVSDSSMKDSEGGSYHAFYK